MKVAVCIERLEAHNLTFREGETYLANMVNPHYWIVDSIGIKTEDFLLHFEVVEELVVDKTSGSTDVTNRKFVEEENDFKKFLNEFGFKDKDV
jgi:hypothetical protein